MQAFLLKAATGVLLDRAAGLVIRVAAGVACAALLLGALAAASLVAVIGAFLPLPAPSGHPSGGAGGAGAPGIALPAARPFAAAGGAAALEIARTQLGRPYVWGGASPETSFDCSGLVQWSFARTGARLPRTAQQQFDATIRLAPSELTPGDLVFFSGTDPASRDWITHVGIYAGGGRMVNAESAGVRDAPVFQGYWAAHYAGAGRPAGGRP